MKRIIRLTESDLTRIVRRVINEQPLENDIIQITKEDIKTITFLDSIGKDIIESYTLDDVNGLVVNVKKGNIDVTEEIAVRIKLDQKFIVGEIQEDKNIDVYFVKNQPTLILIKNPDDILIGKELKPDQKTYVSNISIKNIAGGTLPVSIKFHPDTKIFYGL